MHGVVAGRACDRRIKYLFSYVSGAPSIKPSFLERRAPAEILNSLLCTGHKVDHLAPSVHRKEDCYIPNLLNFLSGAHRCVRAGEWLSLRAADAWRPAKPPCKVFQGYRVYLDGPDTFRQQFGAILPHAGKPLSHVLFWREGGQIKLRHPSPITTYKPLVD